MSTSVGVIVENDALGGAGSFPPVLGLAALLTRGLSGSIDGANSQRYGIGSFSDTLTIDSEGNVTYSQAPQAPPTVGETIGHLLQNKSVRIALLTAAAIGIFAALKG